MTRTSLATAAALLMLANPAWAQYDGGAAGLRSASTPEATRTDSPAPANGFEKLTAGDRKIARALFMAQRPTRNGPAPLSLNQIASLKARNSWAKVFYEMQSRGLIQARTLGQVVSGYEHQRRRNDFRSSDETGRGTTLVVSGSGAVVASSRRIGAGLAHAGDATGETHTTADVAAADRPFRDRPERRER